MSFYHRTLIARVAGGVGMALAVAGGVLLHSAFPSTIGPTVTLSLPIALPVVLLAAVSLVVFAAMRERREAEARNAAQRAELDRQREEGRLLESAVVHAHDAVVVLEADAHPQNGRRVRYVNDAFCAMSGYSRDEVIGRSLHLLRGPESDTATLSRLREALESGFPMKTELQNHRKDGSAYWVELSLVPVREPDGRIGHWVMIQRDITDRKRAEDALRASEEQLRVVGDNVPDGAICQVVASPNAAPRFTYISAGIEGLLGLTPGEVLADNEALYRLIHPEDRPAVQAAEAAAHAALTPFDHEFRVLVRGEKVRWLHARSMPTSLPGGGIAWNGVIIDVTGRKEAEEALRRSEGRYRLLFDSNPHPMWVFDRETKKFLAVNDAAVRVYGYSRDEFLRLRTFDLRPPGGGSRHLIAILPTNGGAQSSQVRRHQKKDGTSIDVELATFALSLEGRPAELVLAIDVTERRRAEDALRRSEELFRGIFEGTSAGVCLIDATGRFVACNPAFATILGRPVGELLNLTPADVTHPDDWTAQLRLVEEIWAGQRDRFEMSERYLRPNGEVVWTELSFTAIRGADGCYEHGLVVVVDATARRRLEEQLRQAQKMEAIGQMAGGVAHDFNNLLTAVLGNLALVHLPEGDPNRPLLAVVEQAASRAADLTRKLLGYARRNQLVTGPVEPREAFAEVVEGLRCTTDLRVRIRVEVAGSCEPVLADPDLLNQALMSLCLNARDAMPGGGTLTLSADSAGVIEPARRPDQTFGIRSGPYVRLSVSDTGTGMTEDVKARIFDPFFTTKEVGKGTGLGLAMVHGIVEQHNGWVDCSSVPGVGTRIDLYLPAVVATPGAATPLTQTPPPVARPGGGEQFAPPAAATEPTVLLVDDEAMIRNLGQVILERAGYRVLTADDGVEAVEVFAREHERIRLVILDVTMPRMSGREAFQRIIQIDPDAQVLFSTGYSAEDIAELEGSIGLLNKPYRPHDLLTVVQDALSAAPVGEGSPTPVSG